MPGPLINQAKRLTGLDPLAYMGVEPVSPTQFITNNQRDPTVNDWQNWDIGAEWLNTSVTPQRVWKLVSLADNQGTWVLLTGGGGGTVTNLKADDGNIAMPALGIISVLGPSGPSGIINTTVPSAHTLQINLSGIVADSFPTNIDGPAVPIAGVLNVLGDTLGVLTKGSGNTVTISLVGGGVAAQSFVTQDGTATPTSLAGVLNIFGSNGLTTEGSANTVTIIGGNVPALNNSFFAYNNTSAAFGTVSSFVTVPFASVNFNNGTNYSTSTYIYTAPVNGYYQFTGNVGVNTITSGTTEYTIGFIVTGASAGSYYFVNQNIYATQAIQSGSPSQNSGVTNGTLFIFMNATDTIKIQLLVGPGGADQVGLIGAAGTPYFTYFSGYQVA
jgi:hypothetical protein